MKLQMQTTIGSFEGMPTAGALTSALSVLPDDARVKVVAEDSQRDGAWWRVEATWTEER